ncbi:MAG: starch synthase, partial [Microcystis aeruginosa]
IRTWESFRYKQDWQKLQQRAMTQDFSWYKSSLEYLKIYKQITGQSDQLSDEEKDKFVALTSS